MPRIPDQNNLFRHCIYPVAFTRQKKLAAGKLIRLYPDPQTNNAFLASLAWERYLPTTEHVHALGCRLAENRNAKPGQSKQIYCGAYQLDAKAVRSLPTLSGLVEIESADVIHRVENGELAHTDLRIAIRPGADVEGTKTAITDRLWNACSGPLKHICDSDKSLASHPSSTLPTPPGGPYRDRRSRFVRIYHVLIFRFLRWSWRQRHQR